MSDRAIDPSMIVSSPFWSSLSPIQPSHHANPTNTVDSDHNTNDPTRIKRNKFGHKLEFDEHDEQQRQEEEEQQQDEDEDATMKDVVPNEATNDGDAIQQNNRTSTIRTSTRIRMKHEATVAVEKEGQEDTEESTDAIPSQLHSAFRTPTRGERIRSHDKTIHHPMALTPTHQVPTSLPATPHMQHLVSSPPTRGSRLSYTESSPSDTGSHLDTSAGSATDSPTQGLTASTYQSPERGSSPEYTHSPSFSPAVRTPAHMSFSPAIRTPQMPSSTVAGKRYNVRQQLLKSSYGVESPGMFSPAPSGMRAARDGDDMDSEDSPSSTHSARQKLQSKLKLDSPGPSSRTRLFEHSASPSIPNSPAPIALGFTGSPVPVTKPIGLIPASSSASPSPETGAEEVHVAIPSAAGLEPTAVHEVQTPRGAFVERAASTGTPGGNNLFVDALALAQMHGGAELFNSRSTIGAQATQSTLELLEQLKPPTLQTLTSFTPLVALPGQSTPPISLSTTSAGHKKCSCKKSKCLKLYCECFARQDFCRGCNCVGCYNTPEQGNQAAREKAILGTMERDPQAFFRAQLSQGVTPIGPAPTMEQILGKDSTRMVQTSVSNTHAPTPATSANSGAVSSKQPLSNVTQQTAAASNRATGGASGSSGKVFRKGCHCRKSECLKRYCECYQAGMACDSSCKCLECKNGSAHDHSGGGAAGGAQGNKFGKRAGGNKAIAHQPIISTTKSLSGATKPMYPTTSGFTSDLYSATSNYMAMQFGMTPEMMQFWSNNGTLQNPVAATNTTGIVAASTVLESVSPKKAPFHVSSSLLSPGASSSGSSNAPTPGKSPVLTSPAPSRWSARKKNDTITTLTPDVGMMEIESEVESSMSMDLASPIPHATSTSKRSSRTITSTVKALEWRAAATTTPTILTTSSSSPVDSIPRKKSSKIRLSSTLDQLPSGRGAGQPADGAPIVGELLEEDVTMEDTKESNQNTVSPPQPRAKRQRHTPPHLNE